MQTPWPADLPETVAAQWTLDPAVDYLNHGAFGACPREVQAYQQALRERLERHPVDFLVRALPGMLEDAIASVADFVHCDPADLTFVSNATAAVNAVLRSLQLSRGDELLTTQHVYNACNNALNFVATRTGARVVVARLPFPVQDPTEQVATFKRFITRRTRLALLDHVSSATGFVLPVAQLIDACKRSGVDTLVDGAHAPGMVPVDLAALGATYYTGNCHKWLCGPKSAAFLYVERASQPSTWPLVISHGYNAPLNKKTRFRECFDWQGTHDPTAALSVPVALRCMNAMLPGGWPAIYAHNRAMVTAARAHLCARWGAHKVVPDALLGSLAMLPLPGAGVPPGTPDPLYQHLLAHKFEVALYTWPVDKKRYMRIAAQLYNRRAQYERLGEVVADWIAKNI